MDDLTRQKILDNALILVNKYRVKKHIKKLKSLKPGKLRNAAACPIHNSIPKVSTVGTLGISFRDRKSAIMAADAFGQHIDVEAHWTRGFHCPPAFIEFIDAFDSGAFPELIDDSWTSSGY